MWASAFSEEEEEDDDDETEDGDGTTSPADAEYNFEGFNIEFSEKVALMPAGRPGKAANGGA